MCPRPTFTCGLILCLLLEHTGVHSGGEVDEYQATSLDGIVQAEFLAACFVVNAMKPRGGRGHAAALKQRVASTGGPDSSTSILLRHEGQVQYCPGWRSLFWAAPLSQGQVCPQIVVVFCGILPAAQSQGCRPKASRRFNFHKNHLAGLNQGFPKPCCFKDRAGTILACYLDSFGAKHSCRFMCASSLL